jgi:hypothetical protein
MSTCKINKGHLTSPVPEIIFRDDKDLLQEARDRLLWQFKNSPNMCKLILLFVDQLQETYSLSIDAQKLRTLALASGKNLDIIGRLVGQERVGITAILGLFGFFYDLTSEPFAEIIDGVPVGGGRFIELGEPESGSRYLEDAEYRRYIVGKIYKNHLRGATACELSEIAVTILDSVTKCQLIDSAPSGNVIYYFYAPNGITSDDKLLIESVTNDVRSEKQRIITAGAGIQISQYIVGSGELVFGFTDDTDPSVGGFSELTTPEMGGNFAELL